MSSTGIAPPLRVNSGKDWASCSVWKMVNMSRDGCWRKRKIEYPSKKQFDGLVFWEVGREESPFNCWVGVGFCSPHDLWWQCHSAWWEYCLCWVRFRNHSIRRWGIFRGPMEVSPCAGLWCAWSRHADHNLSAAPQQQEPEQRELQVEIGCLGRTPGYSAPLWIMISRKQLNKTMILHWNIVPYYCCHNEFASWKLVPSVRLQIICLERLWKCMLK